jgi:hypothetical protein
VVGVYQNGRAVAFAVKKVGHLDDGRGAGSEAQFAPFAAVGVYNDSSMSHVSGLLWEVDGNWVIG